MEIVLMNQETSAAGGGADRAMARHAKVKNITVNQWPLLALFRGPLP